MGPNPVTGVLVKRRLFGHRYHRRMPCEGRDTSGGHHGMAEAGTGVMQLLHASHGCQDSMAPTRSQEEARRLLPYRFQKIFGSADTDFRLLASKIIKQYISVASSHYPGCGTSLWHQEKTNTAERADSLGKPLSSSPSLTLTTTFSSSPDPPAHLNRHPFPCGRPIWEERCRSW